MRIRLFGAITAIALLLYSCIDTSDYELNGVSLSPTLALPLVHGSLTVNDLLSDQDSVHIKEYSDALLYLAYEQELKTQDVRNLFDVPNKSTTKSFILPGVTLPALPKDVRTDSITTTVDLGLSPEQLDEIALRAGQISYSVTNQPPSNLNYEIICSLPGFKSRTTGAALNQVIKGTGTIPLSAYTLTLNKNKFDLKLVLVYKKSTSPVVIANGTSINISLNFGGMQFTYIKGFLGTQTASLPAESINIGVFDQVFDGATLSLAQPKVSLTVTNENGVPCRVDFKKLTASKPGAAPLTMQLNPANPINLNFPTTMGASANTTVTVTNVKQLLDYAPTQLDYQADATINAGLTSGANFVLDTSKLKVKMNVEIPLYGSASNVVLKDTVDIDLSSAKDSDVLSAKLKLKLTNQFPLEGNIQFVLVDANYQVLDALLTANQTGILKGSEVDTGGNLKTPGVYDGEIEIDKTKLEKLFSARHIILVANLQTSRGSGGTAVDVKFKSTYTLEVEAGVLAQVNLQVKQ